MPLRFHVTFIAICLAITLRGAPTCAAGDIVLAAKFFRQSYQGDLFSDGFSHLYRINPDGTGQQRLTYGKQDDYFPSWSPDGRKILFIRVQAGNKVGVCLADERGRKVRTLLEVNGDRDGLPRPEWSPDGKEIFVAWPMFGGAGAAGFYLIDVAKARAQKMVDVRQAAWSPDSRRLYLSGEAQSRILDLKTHSSVRVPDPVTSPFWLDNATVCGISYNAKDAVLRFCNDVGRERKHVELTPPSPDQQLDYIYGQFSSLTWRHLSGQKIYLMQNDRWVSDGVHSICCRVDLHTGRYQQLINGELEALSPDHKRFLVADHDWVGEYKRGGSRVGALEVFTLQNHAARKITPPLVDISGGDWRAAPHVARK